MPKIFLACFPALTCVPGDVLGYALAEDGTGLASHISTNKFYSQHDLGLTSNWKHEGYALHYPSGYELEWVENPEEHEGWKAAMALNQAAHPDGTHRGGNDVQIMDN